MYTSYDCTNIPACLKKKDKIKMLPIRSTLLKIISRDPNPEHFVVNGKISFHIGSVPSIISKV
jgi:hypothetical protein